MRTTLTAFCVALAAMMSPASAISLQLPRTGAYAAAQNGLSDVMLLIVRHVEKPAYGAELRS